MTAPAAVPQPVYLTPEQAGEILSLSPRTLEKLRSNGGGPNFRKLGRRIRYTRADVDAWANSRSFSSTSDPEYFAKRRQS